MKKLILALIVSAAAITALVIKSIHDNKVNHATATKLHEFCAATKMAIAEDEAAFRGSDPVRRDEAYARFYEGQTLYHSATSLQYCLDQWPPLSATCWLNKDWACLADLAHQIGDKLP